MAIALPRRNTEQLCFIFSPITLVFSLLFRSVGYGKPPLSRKLFIYLHYITLKVFFFSLGTVIFFLFFLQVFFFFFAMGQTCCQFKGQGRRGRRKKKKIVIRRELKNIR